MFNCIEIEMEGIFRAKETGRAADLKIVMLDVTEPHVESLVKDVMHREDANRIKAKSGPISMAIISSMAINLHRINGFHSISQNLLCVLCV